MNPSARFRHLLSARLLHVTGVMLASSSVAAGCGGDVSSQSSATGAGGNGASDSSTDVSSSSSSGPSGGGGFGGAIATTTVGTGGPMCGMIQNCIPWNGTADTCPSQQDALVYFQMQGCPDGCYTNAVLSGANFLGGSCCYETSTEACLGTGRPFLVDREARTATLRLGAGWTHAGVAARTARIDEALRAALAEGWARDALLEHASVAAFARFSLELLAVGAPANLVEDAQRAALDEVAHARFCFALASAYGGVATDPGPFPFGGRVEVASNLAEIAARTVVEGCIGETLAAIQASEQLARAADPAVREALTAIAADEARHAELAWRTVAWALAIGGHDVRRAVCDGFARAADQLPSGEDRPYPELLEHGRLDAPTLRDVLSRGLHEVVLPCARALLAARPTTARDAEGARCPANVIA